MTYVSRCVFVVSIGAFAQLAGLCAPARANAASPPEEIIQKEKRLIESRKSIHSGRVVLSNRLTTFPRDPTQVGVEKKYTIYFQGEKFRSDLEVGNRRHQEVSTPDTFIRSAGGARMVDVFGPDTRPKNSQEIPDPRRLGLVVWAFDSINQLGYEEVFLGPNRAEFTIEAGVDAGRSISKVSFRGAEPRPAKFVEYWLSDSQGGLPVFISLRFSEGKTQTLRTVTTKLKQYGAGRIWFPGEVVFRLTTGKEIEAEETVTVVDATFDEDIPESAFALAGLDLPQGQQVDLDGDVSTWMDGRLVKKSNELREEVPVPRSRERQWVLAGLSVVFAVVATLLWWRRAKRSEHVTPPA